jgi:hypothetical protein
MKDVGIFYRHLVYFTAIWYILLSFWYILLSFWYILLSFWYILLSFWYILLSFWYILLSFWYILTALVICIWQPCPGPVRYEREGRVDALSAEDAVADGVGADDADGAEQLFGRVLAEAALAAYGADHKVLTAIFNFTPGPRG